ncbi:phage tail protein [Shewanella algae]|uniref:phage tail-collar fiber domain-containing protein n=1 Tax=Shewanella algae TaxID=38313 RepID=UPI002554F1EC|nr:phage tail protein [Shewanella algae]MDL2195540.1 phage tail protein [Shewanella algae]
MGSVITIAGEKLFAAKAQANQQLDIDTFIFANVPGQDPTAPIDREEPLPPQAQIVHQQVVQQVGRINENVVVYSTVLDSVTGPFEFNWVGLYSSVNQTLVAINHVPTVTKTVTGPGVAGNTLNRNFGIEYSGIADLTGITVAPETWQLDFTARLSGMDELTRQLAADMNGKDWFIGDGFKVVPRATANSFSVTPGVGYVSGMRIELEQEHIINVQTYPQFVYVDAWFAGDANSMWKPQIAFTVSDTEMDDYIDVQGVKHYVYKLALINTNNDIDDLRDSEGLNDKINKSYINTTIAEIKSGKFKTIGMRLSVKDRAGEVFEIFSGGIPDDGSIIDAGNGNTAVLQIKPNTPVEAWGVVANGEDMSEKLALAEKDKQVLIFSSKDGVYLFNTPVETTRSHLVHMTNKDVRIRVNSPNGWFNVNKSPFQLHGSSNEISHVSRILYFGNNSNLVFEQPHLWDFNCVRDDILSDRSPFYFPNSPTVGLNIRNVSGKDANTPANRMVNSEFIQVDWGEAAGTKNININNLDVFGYKGAFGTYGTEYCFGFTARDINSQSATGRGFRNYHCYYSKLENIHLVNNGLPGYAWLAFALSADLRADNSQSGGWEIEQADAVVKVSGRGCSKWLCNPTWGLNGATIYVNSYDNGYACELSSTNTAAYSDIDNLTLYISSSNDALGFLNIDNLNGNHNYRQIDVYPAVTGGNVGSAALRGRNLIPGTTVRIHSGNISGYNYVWDMRIPSGVGELYISADGSNIDYDGSDPIRNDCDSGLNQLFNCKLKKSSDFTAWTGLGQFNRYDNCFDRTSNTMVSG